MAKKLVLALLMCRIAVVFACELPGHFDFEVVNGDEELLYYGCYDAVHRGPHLILYILTKERVESARVRRPSAAFTRDRDGGALLNLLEENGYYMPEHADYTRSGYDRGHMAPNGDFSDTQENALLTFFIANIWPQTPAVNRGEWLQTENEARRLAVEYLVVRVVIIVDEFGENRVKDIQVPSVFKKRVFDVYTGELIYEIDVYQ